MQSLHNSQSTDSTSSEEDEIEYTPSPIPSPIAPRISTAAAAPSHLLNPYRVGNPPNLRFLKFIDATPIPAHINDAFVKELTASKNMLNTTSKFLENLLPRERLPFPVNKELLTRLSKPIGGNAPIWNEPRSCFHQSPLIDMGELAVCKWLNNIGMTMGLVYGRQCERVWWSGSGMAPGVVASSIQQKPDLVLLDRSYYDQYLQNLYSGIFSGVGWAFVKAVAAVHPEPNARLTKSYLTFFCQPHRRFTILLSFFNPTSSKFSVTVLDRVGQICVTQIDLMLPSDENGLFLLSILAFLMFGSPEDVGLDPHFEIDPSHGYPVAVEIENRRFGFLKRIHTSPTLFGRGTQVWVVCHNGVRYIVKDSWVREDHNSDEVGHLRRMLPHEELKGRVPTLICGGDVIINGFKDSTQRYRSAPCTHRIHRRIVTSPVGESLSSFKSKKELIRVMISILETHRYLCNRVGTLHCDLSLNNIMLNRKDNESEAIGLLIDYDYSVDTGATDLEHTVTRDCAPDASDTRAADDTGHVAFDGFITPRNGTPPFMSVEALLVLNKTFVHKPRHDLESILHCILHICTYFPGPGLPFAVDLDPRIRSAPIRTWSHNMNNYGDSREIGYLKLAHLECHDMALLPFFAPYWCDFAPFVKDLIIACYPVAVRLPNDLQYDRFLQILETAYDSVEEPETAHISHVPASQALKRAGGDLLDRDSKKGRPL